MLFGTLLQLDSKHKKKYYLNETQRKGNLSRKRKNIAIIKKEYLNETIKNRVFNVKW